MLSTFCIFISIVSTCQVVYGLFQSNYVSKLNAHVSMHAYTHACMHAAVSFKLVYHHKYYRDSEGNL